ncbi:MAG: hypothetical protein ACP5MC_01510, partial [Candidatus Micrarchaeia archaeon]
MRNAVLFFLIALSIVPYFYASNLTSCISCSQVTCPAGATCHNIGSCPNGFVLWGCQYANGTIVSTKLSNSTTTNTITTTTPSTTLTTSIRPPVPAPASSEISNTTIYEIVAIAAIAVIAAAMYYMFASKKLNKVTETPPT